MTVTETLIRTTEQRLLVLAARAFIEPESRDDLRRQAEPGLDWGRFVACARQNKLLPLAYRVLSAEATDLVPAQVLADLRRRYQENARRNLRLTAELLRLIGRLEAAGIPALPVKGPMLAQKLYGDLGMRQFWDLDVLVAPGQYLRALTVVEDLGYRVVTPGVMLTQGQSEALIRLHGHHHLGLRNRVARIDLELHWSLATGRRVLRERSTDFWRRLETTELAGRKVAELGAEDLLLYLCLHASHDHWQRFSLVLDLAQALHEHDDLRWEELLDRAERRRCLLRVLVGPYLAHHLLRLPLPAPLEAQVRDRARTLGAIARRSDLFRESTVWQRHRYWVGLHEGPLRKAGCILDALLAPRVSTIEFVQLPGALFPLYFAVRPVQLLVKLCRQAVSAWPFGERQAAGPEGVAAKPTSEGRS